MREREECSYQNACLFSHSITEMAIWQIQKQSKSLKGVMFRQFSTIYFSDGLREHEAILDKLISITRDNKGETNMILA